MKATTYLRIDPDDLDDVLTKIEQSYSITFGTNELRQVETFGQLCETISGKIQRPEVADCTTQQAFYKLRQHIVDVLHVERKIVHPTTELAVLFPKSTRRTSVSQLEEALGFNLEMTMASPYLTIPAQILLIISAVVLFNGNAPLYAGGGALLAISMYVLAGKLARYLRVKTVGELAGKLAREHYTKVRRDASTVNKREITNQIRQVFCTDLGISSETLKPNSLLTS